MSAHYSTDYSIKNGQLTAARQCFSPNFDSRKANTVIDLLVIHCIALPPEQYGGSAIEDFFCNRLNTNTHPFYHEIATLKVSAHLLIRRDGEALQFVNFSDRAWHAGESCFEGRERCNDFSIGIELEGRDTDTFSDAQYTVLAQITRALQAAYPEITAANIVGHQDVAPQRKTDPGKGFDWQRYRAMLCR
jgi:AmpD protein